MKKILIDEIFRTLKTKSQLHKKLKFFLVIALVALVFIGSFTLYLGVVGVRYLASVGQEINIAEQTHILKDKVQSLPKSIQPTCLTAAQSMLSLEKLTQKPLIENVQELKTACLSGEESKEIKKSNEGVPI